MHGPVGEYYFFRKEAVAVYSALQPETSLCLPEMGPGKPFEAYVYGCCIYNFKGVLESASLVSGQKPGLVNKSFKGLFKYP
ncbi:hypothetical protein FACS189447_08960 [Spirochaetia bacterium]|nr:hypothetical protein FACS189447_08960 [Spirochaetia bacterium]